MRDSDDDSDGGDQFAPTPGAQTPAATPAPLAPAPGLSASRRDSRRDSKLVGRGSEASKLVQLQLEYAARQQQTQDDVEQEVGGKEEEEEDDGVLASSSSSAPSSSLLRKNAVNPLSSKEEAVHLSRLANDFELRKTASELAEGEAGIAAEVPLQIAAPAPAQAPAPVIHRSAASRERAVRRKMAAQHVRAFDRVFEPSKLSLTLMGARNLASSIGALFAPKPDPFVVVRLDGLEVARSRIQRCTARPEWGETLDLQLPLDRDYTDCVVELKVYDANDGMGEMRVRAGVVGEGGEEEDEEDDAGTTATSSKKKSSFMATIMGVPDRDGVSRFLGKVTFSGAQQLTWLGSASDPAAVKWLPLYTKRRSGHGGDIKITAKLIPGAFRDVPRPAPEDDDTLPTLLTDAFFSTEGGDASVPSDGDGREDEEEEGEEEEEEDEDADDCIEVTVLAAKNLGKADLLGLSDPYAVVIYNGVEIGRSTVVDNCLYPRWQGQRFRVVVPAGAGVYYEGNDSVLRVDVYDSNAAREDVFLGCCVVEKGELESLLGLKANAITAADTDAGPDFRCPYADQIERGAPMWFPLAQDKARSMQQNKLVRGGLQLAGAYISGTLVASPPPPRRLSIHIEAATGLAKAGAAAKSSMSSSLSGLLSSSSSKKAAPGAQETATTSSFCVVHFNGCVVGRTHVVKQSYDPCFHTHLLVSVPAEWDLRLCSLEVEVYGEASMAGKLSGSVGPFLGAAVVRGQELIELLSGRMTPGGEHVFMSFPLRPSEHVAKDDQTLVRGSVSLRGSLDDMRRQHQAAWLEISNGGGEAVSSAHLVVGVAEAASLAQTDRFGTANAFVQVTWNGRLRGTTSVVPNQLNPAWESDNEFSVPLPLDVQLADCVLEFRVQDKSRMGKFSLLGEKRLTGAALEALVQLRGELHWLDLEPSRYLGDKANALVTGSLRVRCQYFGSSPPSSGPPPPPPPLATKSYQPARVRVAALGIAEIAPLAGLKSMAALTSRSAPFLQLLWNGREVGCTTPLSISALVLDDAEAATRVHEWKDESFCFFLGEDLVEDSRLEIVGWDCGLLTGEGQNTFLGRRVLTGSELARAVFHTTDYAAIIAGQAAVEPAEPVWLALGRTWDLPLEEQTSVRPRVLLDVTFEPEHFAELTEEELDEQEEESARLLAMAMALEGGPILEEGGRHGSDALLPSGEEKGEARSIGDDAVTVCTTSTDEVYTEEELAQLERDRRDEHWARLKAEHRISIPPGALHYFTKHYEEQSGKFYYYDHVTGLATYDRPPGELRLHKTDEELDNLRVVLEARAKGAVSAQQERAVLMLKIRAEKDAAVAYHLNQKRAHEVSEQKKVCFIDLSRFGFTPQNIFSLYNPSPPPPILFLSPPPFPQGLAPRG